MSLQTTKEACCKSIRTSLHMLTPLLPRQGTCHGDAHGTYNCLEGTGGRIVRAPDVPSDKLEEARSIRTAWRTMHALPLAYTHMLLKRYICHDSLWPTALVSARMKRMPSIIGKLRRFPHMQASRMQDIGGVRVIVDTVQDVYDLYDAVSGSGKVRQIPELPPSDYIANPKPDGYRSLHLVFRHANTRHPESNGLRVELQIRLLQHAWATAVETLGQSSARPSRPGRETRLHGASFR